MPESYNIILNSIPQRIKVSWGSKQLVFFPVFWIADLSLFYTVDLSDSDDSFVGFRLCLLILWLCLSKWYTSTKAEGEVDAEFTELLLFRESLINYLIGF